MTATESFHEAHAIWKALLDIKFEVADHPVSPRIAWKQACLHLKPLLPAEHQEVFTARSRVKWDTMLIAYVELLGRSNGENIDLMNMATAVRILFRHTTQPPSWQPENIMDIVPLEALGSSRAVYDDECAVERDTFEPALVQQIAGETACSSAVRSESVNCAFIVSTATDSLLFGSFRNGVVINTWH